MRGDLPAALAVLGAANVRFLLDELTPLLQAAVDGDPATPVGRP